MPNVTLNTVLAKSTAANKVVHQFTVQTDADNKFLAIAADYDNREGYLKTTDTAIKKVYTFLNFTITLTNE